MGPRKRFLLRVDPKLYDALEKWAADELRSVNAQIEYLLTDAARRSGRLRGSGSRTRTDRRSRGDAEGS